MEHEKLSYPEALQYLAKKYNIEIVVREETAQEKEAKNERESLLSVNQYACQYFAEVLHSPEGKAIGMSYFIERGFREDTIHKFQLGYAREEKRYRLKNEFRLIFAKSPEDNARYLYYMGQYKKALASVLYLCIKKKKPVNQPAHLLASAAAFLASVFAYVTIYLVSTKYAVNSAIFFFTAFSISSAHISSSSIGSH